MRKTVQASSLIKQAIENLDTLNKTLASGLESIAPKDESDFVMWFIHGQRDLGVHEITALQLEQAAESFGVQLTRKGGWWIRACGFEKNRTKSGLRWYDIRSLALPDQITAPDFAAWGDND